MPMRAAIIALCVAATHLGGRSALADDAARKTTPALRLVWLDPGDVAAGSELAARAEATRLLSRMGATVFWRRGAGGEQAEPGEIRVVLLGAGPEPSSGPPVLGATRTKLGVAPVVWVRVPHVRAAVGIPECRSLLGLEPASRNVVATALGRVIAHEVVHALVPSLAHGHGLMADRLTRRQLTAPSILVDSEVAAAVLASFRGNPVFAPPLTGLLAAEAVGRE